MLDQSRYKQTQCGTQYCSTVVLLGSGQQSRIQQSTVVQQYISPAPELGLWGET